MTRVHTAGVFYREGRYAVVGERPTGALGSTSELLTPTPYRSATFPREWIRPHPFRFSGGRRCASQASRIDVRKGRMNASHATSVLTIDIHSKRGKERGSRLLRLQHSLRRFGAAHLRRFQLTGMTTSKDVQRMRVSKSCYLLQFSKLNAEEIAWRSGYPDAAPSARSFIGYVGLTPGEYRRRFGAF